MIDHDSTDAEVEELLRATFASEARLQVSDARPVPPFPATEKREERLATVHPLRRKWVGISVVAAALVAVAIGATVIGTEAMHSERRPIQPATSGAPTPTAPNPTTSSTASPTTAVSTSASTATGPTTRDVEVGGQVSLIVPFAWNDIGQPGIGGTLVDSVCLTPDSTITSSGPIGDNCVLHVSVGNSLSGFKDPDTPGFTPDGGICGTDGRTPHQRDTVQADEVTIDGQVAQHRVFTGFCLSNTVEQWTVPTSPFIQFWRAWPTSDPAGDSQAAAIVQAAKLPPADSSLRLFDRGYVTGMTGATVSLDRITLLGDGKVENTNPTTYAYPLTASTRITYVHGETKDLTVADLRTLAAGGTVAGVPPVDTLYAEVDTDGSSVTDVNLYPRTS